MGCLISPNCQLTPLLGFLLYSLVVCLSYPTQPCPSEESIALLGFKQHFSINCKATSLPEFECGHYHEPKTLNWKEGIDCCGWDGVTCDGVTGHVIGLLLGSSCLYGTIHLNSSLYNLIHLQELDLGCNNLNYSQISPSIALFTNLTHLYLSFSGLSGEIPSESIFHLPKLQMLSLSGNRELTGKIPSFNGTSQLSMLDLSSTGFTGELPNSIGLLKFVERLELYDCNFSGSIPISLGNLTQLTHLDLSLNHFSGTVPSSISDLENLLHLDLSSNNFEGGIPQLFAKLTKLELLALGGNTLSGQLTQLPSSFSNLSQLYLIDFSDNQLTGPIPSSITDLPNLEILVLSNNKLNKELHPLICSLRSLRFLDLSHNQICGLILACLGNSSGELYALNLQGNNFHGTIPQAFGNITFLHTLDISHNGLQGVLPRSLANCTNLEVLNLGYNSIVDVFPFWLEDLPELKVLVLRDNRFHSPIGPPSKGLAFTNLHNIDLSHNEFIGTLPSEYFESWHSMMVADEDASQQRYLDDNTYYTVSVIIMNKGLEMELGRILTILKVVDLSYNKFNGKIPISIGRLKALCVLNFSGNGLIGSIPLSLGNLTELESLDLSQNNLSGEIPQQLTSLTFLEVLDVSQNNLTGLIPRGRQFETFSNTSYDGNPGLCGFPLSVKCGNVKVTQSPSSPTQLSNKFRFKAEGFGWEAVLMGYGCGVVLGLVIGSCIILRNEEWLGRIFRVKMHQQGKKSKRVR